MNKTNFFILVFVIFLSACNNADKNTEAPLRDSMAEIKLATDTNAINAAIDSAHNAQNSLDWKGTYKGILPCADCEGIETEIVLNADQTYVLTRKYLGKGSTIRDKKVPFSWIDGSTISLDGVIDGPSKYWVTEGKLVQLYMNGKRPAAKDEKKNTLIKQP